MHCRHCGIRFLTHPRNANRRNLHCRFGCREYRRRQQANARSTRHYRTDQGRRNKKLLNAKRSASACDPGAPRGAVPCETAFADPDASCPDASSGTETAAQPRPDPTHQPGQISLEEASREDVKLTLDGFTLDEATLVTSPMLPYLTMVAILIERREIRCEELLHALLRSMRQRSFDRLPRREYVLCFLNRHPP